MSGVGSPMRSSHVIHKEAQIEVCVAPLVGTGHAHARHQQDRDCGGSSKKNAHHFPLSIIMLRDLFLAAEEYQSDADHRGCKSKSCK